MHEQLVYTYYFWCCYLFGGGRRGLGIPVVLLVDCPSKFGGGRDALGVPVEDRLRGGGGGKAVLGVPVEDRLGGRGKAVLGVPVEDRLRGGGGKAVLGVPVVLLVDCLCMFGGETGEVIVGVSRISG